MPDIRDIMNAAVGHEVGDIIEVPEKRVFTYTRTYRIETTLSDEELIRDVNEVDGPLEMVYNAETLSDALDALAVEHEVGVAMDDVKVELHSTHHELKDPGFF